ncbi:Protein deglycase DJ-1zDJ-1 [Globodera pallida]|nr:Protein deglycase DJ-1zDJ-1 [Globodera pallida]
MSAKTALVIASNDSEESELVITVDVLRRAGVNVTIASLQDEKIIHCHEGINIQVDALLSDVQDDMFDAVILPGGPGSQNLADDERVGRILERHNHNGKVIGAICGGPQALASHKIASGAQITAYPAMQDKFSDYNFQKDARVCVCKNLITSQAPGTAFEFGVDIAKQLVGAEKAEEVRNFLLVR